MQIHSPAVQMELASQEELRSPLEAGIPTRVFELPTRSLFPDSSLLTPIPPLWTKGNLHTHVCPSVYTEVYKGNDRSHNNTIRWNSLRTAVFKHFRFGRRLAAWFWSKLRKRRRGGHRQHWEGKGSHWQQAPRGDQQALKMQDGRGSEAAARKANVEGVGQIKSEKKRHHSTC